MSTFIALIVLGAAVWFASGMAGARRRPAHEPSSISDFARAMTALAPTASSVRRQAATARPPTRRRPPTQDGR